MQPPRLRLAGGGRGRLLGGRQQDVGHANHTTTTTSAFWATAHHGRLPDHHDFGRLIKAEPDCEPTVDRQPIRQPHDHHDFGRCRCCPSRPSVQPPRLRPVPQLPMAAVRTTTTPSACGATAHSGRLPNHHDFGRCLRPTVARPTILPSVAGRPRAAIGVAGWLPAQPYGQSVPARAHVCCAAFTRKGSATC